MKKIVTTMFAGVLAIAVLAIATLAIIGGGGGADAQQSDDASAGRSAAASGQCDLASDVVSIEFWASLNSRGNGITSYGNDVSNDGTRTRRERGRILQVRERLASFCVDAFERGNTIYFYEHPNGMFYGVWYRDGLPSSQSQAQSTPAATPQPTQQPTAQPTQQPTAQPTQQPIQEQPQ